MYRSRTSGRGGSPPPRPRAALGAAIGTALAVSVLLTIFVVYIWKGHPPIQPTEFFVSAIVTLLAILIAGAFLFATFRIEHQAMAEARVAAREVAEEVVTEELVQEAVDNHVRQNQTVFSIRLENGRRSPHCWNSWLRAYDMIRQKDPLRSSEHLY